MITTTSSKRTIHRRSRRALGRPSAWSRLRRSKRSDALYARARTKRDPHGGDRRDCSDGRWLEILQPWRAKLAAPERSHCLGWTAMAMNKELQEQRTLNQRVQGSSPCAPTNKINNLSAN